MDFSLSDDLVELKERTEPIVLFRGADGAPRWRTPVLRTA